jgi:phospholipase/carboxylesterase
MNADPHGQGALRRAGAGAARARLAVVLLHGCGAGADAILPLASQLGLVDAALFAPEAAGRSWWPVSFLAPLDRLQPWPDSALCAVGRALAAAKDEGFETAARSPATATIVQGTARSP